MYISDASRRVEIDRRQKTHAHLNAFIPIRQLIKPALGRSNPPPAPKATLERTVGAERHNQAPPCLSGSWRPRHRHHRRRMSASTAGSAYARRGGAECLVRQCQSARPWRTQGSTSLRSSTASPMAREFARALMCAPRPTVAPRHLAQTPLTRDCRAPALVAGAGRAVVRADPGGEQGNRYPGQPPPRTVLDLHQLSAAPLALARRLPPLLPRHRGELRR